MKIVEVFLKYIWKMVRAGAGAATLYLASFRIRLDIWCILSVI
jgi:hypothetical protein